MEKRKEKERQSKKNTVENREERKRDEEETRQGVEEEEIVTAIRRMKRKEAPGIDEIPMEAWWYGGSTIRKVFVDLLKQVWNENTIPADWKISVPIQQDDNNKSS